MARSSAPPIWGRLLGGGSGRHDTSFGRTASQRIRLSVAAQRRLGRGRYALGSVSACLVECLPLIYFVKCIITLVGRPKSHFAISGGRRRRQMKCVRAAAPLPTRLAGSGTIRQAAWLAGLPTRGSRA
jgi:hypothetical protein